MTDQPEALRADSIDPCHLGVTRVHSVTAIDSSPETSRFLTNSDVPEGYELEVFAAAGQTIAVVSVPASADREATEHDVLYVREARA